MSDNRALLQGDGDDGNGSGEVHSDKLASSWTQVDVDPQPGASGASGVGAGVASGDVEGKSEHEIPAAVVAKIRAEAAKTAREECLRVLGDSAKYFLSPSERTKLVKRAYFVVTAEVQLSGFVKHLFTSAWVEILLMLLGFLFYFGDTSASTAHFVFIYVLHLLRAPAVLLLLNRVPSFDAVVLALGGGGERIQEERDLAVMQLRDLKCPIFAVTIFTALCGLIDMIAVFVRLWSFSGILSNEVAPSVLMLLLGLAFVTIDFAAIFWYFSLKYNLPKEAVDSLTRAAIHQSRAFGDEVGQTLVALDRQVLRRNNARQAGHASLARTPDQV